MISLSTRTKESIKTGLAMTIAYGIALSMDWEKPYWAGFAVALLIGFVGILFTGLMVAVLVFAVRGSLEESRKGG